MENWGEKLLKRYPGPVELQNNSTMYKASVDGRSVSITFYDADIPKMNIQGNHGCIKRFVLDILPDVYKAVKEEIECIEPVSSDKVPASRQKMKINEELQLHCEVCAKPYKWKSALEAHFQQKHGISEKLAKILKARQYFVV